MDELGFLHEYFAGEKSESLIFAVVGAVQLLAALLLFTRKSPLHRGAAIPIFLIALIQLIVGGAVYLRTDQQVADLVHALANDRANALAVEISRMVTVNFWFDVYKIIELALAFTGVAMAFMGSRRSKNMLIGAGLALALESSLMLIADFIAESRAATYTDALTQIR